MNNFFITTVGVCECDEGYTEDDCSVNIRKPPDVFGISEESLCDIIKRPCSSVSLFGTGFYHSDSVLCQIVQAKVMKTRNCIFFLLVRNNLMLIVRTRWLCIENTSHFYELGGLARPNP